MRCDSVFRMVKNSACCCCCRLDRSDAPSHEARSGMVCERSKTMICLCKGARSLPLPVSAVNGRAPHAR